MAGLLCVLFRLVASVADAGDVQLGNALKHETGMEHEFGTEHGRLLRPLRI